MRIKPFGRAVALFVVSIASVALAGSSTMALAATDPGLGTGLSFAAMGGSAVTNTGPSVINGDLGVAPGTSVTGFPPGQVNGATHLTDAVALQAQDDLTTAYNSAAAQPLTQDLTGQDLGGKVLIPGVYRFSSSAQLTGPLALDGQDSTNAVFIFQVGSTLTTASASTVSLINGAQGCNIWWQIGSSATLGSSSTFRGNLMALTSISATTGANIPGGRLLARNGALTLDTNVITIPTDCTVASPAPTASPSASPSPGASGTPTGGGPTVLHGGATGRWRVNYRVNWVSWLPRRASQRQPISGRANRRSAAGRRHSEYRSRADRLSLCDRGNGARRSVGPGRQQAEAPPGSVSQADA